MLVQTTLHAAVNMSQAGVCKLLLDARADSTATRYDEQVHPQV